MRGSTPGCSHTGSQVIVADTGAFIAGSLRGIYLQVYTSPGVVDEVRDRDSVRVLEELEASGKLIVMDPPQRALEAARRIKTKGLSSVDLEVLALALYLRELGCNPIIATDDYALQEAASRLGVPFARIRYRGARRARL